VKSQHRFLGALRSTYFSCMGSHSTVLMRGLAASAARVPPSTLKLSETTLKPRSHSTSGKIFKVFSPRVSTYRELRGARDFVL
jgi:hypothetical protein